MIDRIGLIYTEKCLFMLEFRVGMVRKLFVIFM